METLKFLQCGTSGIELNQLLKESRTSPEPSASTSLNIASTSDFFTCIPNTLNAVINSHASIAPVKAHTARMSISSLCFSGGNTESHQCQLSIEVILCKMYTWNICKGTRYIPDPSVSISSKHSLRSCLCCFVNSGRTNLPWARNQPAIDNFCNTACIIDITITQPIFPILLFVEVCQQKVLFEARWSMWNLLSHVCILCGFPRHHEESPIQVITRASFCKPNTLSTPHCYCTSQLLEINDYDIFSSSNVVENGLKMRHMYPLYNSIKKR